VAQSTLAARPFYGSTKIMRKSIAVVPKKRGRPATGRDPVTAIRLSSELRGRLDDWRRVQDGLPSRSEAIRRLVERALVAEPPAPRSRNSGAPKAAEMASHEINKLGDKSATDEERATRKRRLISGPKEFRGIRRK
jgi:hypothetical protein